MKNKMKTLFSLTLLLVMMGASVTAQQDKYTQRFLDMYEKLYDPANGYFSADGVPYHSVETLMCEAPDHGHETTSEAYSYWIWVDAMYGGITGDWNPLNNSWEKMEQFAIPTDELQPTTSDYDPAAPATFASEHPLPSFYPSELETSVPVGTDPVSEDLTSTYGSNIYGMHWLFDCDNIYGFGIKGDGVSTPSYINTFQRGEQESVWETVPQPSWEDFSWGADDGTGYLTLFTEEGGAPSEQWKYTNAPDADARAVQAMYWASEFAKEQGLDPNTIIPMEKASKMGDFVRLAMFDKYFKPLGVQDKNAPGASGYESAHYLLSWYYAWGGPLSSQGWAWRIGCSHAHFGYQNPVAAYALSEYDDLKPNSANGVRDWGRSLDRQVEFYTWLQSAEGGIAGGATNSYNGSYDAYPDSLATFYDMAYTVHPVYHDPGSNQWFGMQAWSMERIAELYYITNDVRTKTLMDNWISWVKSEVKLYDDGTFEIPAELTWTGQPNTWNPDNPTPNNDLHVTVKKYGVDLGIAGCLAKAITYYAAATEKYETLDEDAKNLASEILDRIHENYYEEDGAGYAATEKRGDYTRFFEQEVYVPEGWSGAMPNGDIIEPGIKFIDIRSFYKNDPEYAALEAAYNAGTDYEVKYHRFWAQADIALANAEFGRLFGEKDTVPTSITVNPESLLLEIGDTSSVSATVIPTFAHQEVIWTSTNTAIATVGTDGLVSALSDGSVNIIATTVAGGLSDTCLVTVVDEIPNYILDITIVGSGDVALSPEGGVYPEGTSVTLSAGADVGYQFDSWSGDASGSELEVTVIMDSNKEVIATFTEVTGPCDNPVVVSLPFIQEGIGDYCFFTTDEISFVNSWNMESVIINNVDYTNTWSSNMPAKLDDGYYFQYKSSVEWAHFEANKESGNSGITTETQSISSKTQIYPNPFNESITIELADVENTSKIVVYNQTGKPVLQFDNSEISSRFTLGNNLSSGIYFIAIQTATDTKTIKVVKK